MGFKLTSDHSAWSCHIFHAAQREWSVTQSRASVDTLLLGLPYILSVRSITLGGLLLVSEDSICHICSGFSGDLKRLALSGAQSRM